MAFQRIFRNATVTLLALCLAGCAFPADLTALIQPAAATPIAQAESAPPPTATLPAAPAAEPTQEAATPLPPAEPLWIANEADGTLMVIDTAANAPAVLIPTNLYPFKVVSGLGAVWALDRFNDILVRLHPESYAVEATLKITQGDVQTLAVGEGAVWIGISERPESNVLRPHEEYVPAGGVLRVDPQNVRVTGYAPVGPVIDLDTGMGVVWALVSGQVETPLMRIDPVSLQAGSIDLKGTHDWLLADALAVDSQSLWLYSQAFGKLYHSDASGQLYAEIELPQNRPFGLADLLVTPEGVWLAAPWGAVLHITPSGEIAAEIETGVPLGELQNREGALWAVSPQTGSALRIDSASQTLVARVALGSPLQPTPRVTATAIQRAEQVCEEGPFTRLALGMRAYTNNDPPVPNRLREEAGVDFDIVGYIQPGEIVRIEEGPACADGWVWWKVTTDGGYTGWTAEGDANEYWLIPLKY